ncbi:hemolysin family protein [Parasedimentitalea psychrophila]|uniref:Hemolysin family protein n=2 Tax=Parasedimentitalea psychrophila TaxID=2997337 RepID=A0A9Y2L3H3_9RHOB|nr:hemolysin family protein [Parasedimentitalea psychrophila]WIY27443.1 hemolysin family protein [Parasedimentitalea psychrophila]
MGDIDGSSNAAHSAQQSDNNAAPAPETPQRIGFWRRFFGMMSRSEVTPAAAVNGHAVPQAPPLGIINLSRMRVEDVAIPTAEIIAVPISIPMDELVTVFRDSGLTRIPVYEGTLDTPLGFAHLKDFALTHGFSNDDRAFDLALMIRPLLFVPPSMPIGVLLSKMQTERRHMALVIDEYGGVDGLLTIEDLIEQVVGEIEDEHDAGEDQTWFKEKTGCYIAQARTPLDEFEAEIGRSLTNHEDVDEEEIDSLGGLVFMLSGRVPARGEVVIHPDGPEFEVMDADPRRIKRLRVRLPDEVA